MPQASIKPRVVSRQRQAPPPPIDDPIETARAAGLRYVAETTPGIRRERAGDGFIYIGLDGQPIRDPETLERIRKLAIPPAWTNVWISPIPRGHIQATGRDSKGRKQYRYHDLWRWFRDATKYGRMVAFGEALPTIRQHVDRDLARPGLSRERVLATVLRLLDESRLRIGNEEYAKQNGSYGLTTLRDEHVEVSGARLRFQFRGKSGKYQVVEVEDRRVAKIVRQLQDLPGQHLFEYLDDEGRPRPVESEDVNEYLRQVSGQDVTAKDFRTWSGTVLAAGALKELGEFTSESEAKKKVAQAIKSVTQMLGNTPTVCRKCYIHPAVIEAYLSRSLLRPAGGSYQMLVIASALRRGVRWTPARRERNGATGFGIRRASPKRQRGSVPMNMKCSPCCASSSVRPRSSARLDSERPIRASSSPSAA